MVAWRGRRSAIGDGFDVASDHDTPVRLPFLRVAVRDWGSAPGIVELSFEEQGVLWHLERTWWEHGQLPVALPALARLGVPVEQHMPLVDRFFPVDAAGTHRCCPRLHADRAAAMTTYLAQAKAGRRSASSRKRSGPAPRKAASPENAERTPERGRGRPGERTQAVPVLNSPPTTTTAGVREGVLTALPASCHEPLERLLRSTGNPSGVLDHLSRLLGTHPHAIPAGDGLRFEDPKVVGEALIDLANAGQPNWSPAIFRAFLKRSKQADTGDQGTALSPGERVLAMHRRRQAEAATQ